MEIAATAIGFAFPYAFSSPFTSNVSHRCMRTSHYGVVSKDFQVYPRRFSLLCSASKKLPDTKSRRPAIAEWHAGGNGPLSAEFLAVTGALSTIAGVAALVPLAFGFLQKFVIQDPLGKALCLAFSSFAYGLFLARFDLRKMASLKLTIVFSLLMRFICIPVLSHMVAIAGYALVKVKAAKTAAAVATAAAAAKAPATVKATTATLSLPAGVLSSLFLLSTTPIGFAPPAAMLSLHVHTTLLAILTVLTLILFPFLPSVSHGISLWAHKSAFLNIGAILPKVAPPPGIPFLLATTTVPVLLGLGLSKIVPRRWALTLGFFALPMAWISSLLLLASAVVEVAAGSATGLVGSIGLCGGVAVMMVLLGRALGAALLLDEKAKRTLTLYLSTQGTVIGAGVAPAVFPSAPLVASTLVGLVSAVLMSRAWSHVIIRTNKAMIS